MFLFAKLVPLPIKMLLIANYVFGTPCIIMSAPEQQISTNLENCNSVYSQKTNFYK